MSGEVDKLSYYGHNFQIKVLSALICDSIFLQRISDILDPLYFDSEGSQWIVKTVVQYYNDYKSLPTADVLKVKISEESDTTFQLIIKENLKEVFKFIDSVDLEFIKEQTIDFCKNQELKKAILLSVDLLKKGQYDDIKSTIDAAMKAGNNTMVTYDYINSIEQRYATNIRNTIKTGWDAIDAIADGGFGKGELIVFVAGPGSGKSTALVNVGAHAIQHGKRVVHFTLELYEDYTSRKYDAVISGITQQDLRYHIDELNEILPHKVTGELIVEYYPDKTASVNTLRAYVNQLIILGKKPDLIIVDYADKLKSAIKYLDKQHIEMGNIYTELRGLAGEFEVPIYTASQTNRDGAESDIIVGTQVAASFEKIMIADFVVSLSRKMTDKLAGTGRWHIIKNRFGPDGMTFPSKLNMGTGRMDIYEEDTIKGKEAKNDMENGNLLLRKQLSTKFKEFNINKSKDSLG